MTARVLGSVLVMLALVMSGGAAIAASSTVAVAAKPRSGAAAAPRASGAKSDAVVARTRTAAADTGAVARQTSRTSAGAKARSAGASRQLETTHIQGDIPVPQVLFVTARDQRRFMSAHHQRYLKTSKTFAEATPIPTRMIVTRGERPEVER